MNPTLRYLPSFSSRIIIIDPIDPKRNLGAGISAELLGNLFGSPLVYSEPYNRILQVDRK